MKTKTQLSNRILSLVLTLVMVLGMMPLSSLTAFAADTSDDLDTVASGTCGTKVNWVLDSDGVLTISGSGKMTSSPWGSSSSIKEVIIEEGVTSIRTSAFRGCSQLTTITVKGNLTEVGGSAFQNCSRLKSATFLGDVGTVGYMAFNSSTSTLNLTIHGNATSFGKNVFALNYTKVNITYNGTNIPSAPSDGGIFEGSRYFNDTKIYVTPAYYAQSSYFCNVSVVRPVMNITVTSVGNGTAEAQRNGEPVTSLGMKYKATLVATPNDGYYLKEYQVVSGGITIDESNSFTVGQEDIEIKAIFEAIPGASYTVSFDANGGTGNMDMMTVENGKTETLPKNLFVRNNYSFKGWTTAPDGTGTPYADEANISYTSMGGNITLYAQWEKITYSVTYEANGGTGTMETLTVEASDSDNYTFPECGFTAPDGKVFSGWKYSTDTGTSTSTYIPGEIIRIRKNITVTAQWAAPVAEVTIGGTTTPYGTLELAAAAVAGKTATVKLLDNVTLTDRLIFNATNLTLDLNNKSISDYYLTLYNTVSITGPGTLQGDSMWLDIERNAAVTFSEGVAIEKDSTANAIQMNYGSKLILNGGSVTRTDGTPAPISGPLYSDQNSPIVVVNADGVTNTFGYLNVYFNITPTTKPTKPIMTKGYFYYKIDNQIAGTTLGGTVTYDGNTYATEGANVTVSKDGLAACYCNDVAATKNQDGTFTFTMPAAVATITDEPNHIHVWEYNAEGVTITATCTDADGKCPNINGGSVILNVTDTYYTGSAIGATVTGSFTNGATYKVTYNDGAETAPSSIGAHTATLMVSENGTEKQSVTAEYKISYLPAPNPAYAISGGYQNGDTYWFKTGSSVTVNAPNGYTVSKALNGAFGSSISFSESDSKVIYLKRTTDDALTDAINVEGIRFDGNGSTGKITIENRGFWERLFNKITFGLFFKGDAVAKVSAIDDESGWKTIQYYVADEDLINDDTLNNAAAVAKLENAIGNNWKDYSNEIALNKNSKNIIYVKITDNVGNVTYISSEGIVLYSDAEAVTESVSTTYKAGADKDVTVELNGNTVNAIKNGADVLAGADYNVSANGTITLKASYLDTLNAGAYTFTVSYNPLGEVFVGTPSNDAPKATTFKVVIEKADGKVSNINISGKTYDGTAVTAPTFDKLGDGEATIEYKDLNADDSTYTTTAPKNAGDYIVRVTVAEGTNYKAASATAEFTISRATLKDVSVQQNGKLTYDGGKALTPAVTANATAFNGAEVYFMYSTSQYGNYGTMPAFTDAGTYTVYYCAYTVDNNFFDHYDAFTVTIDKATVNEPTIASKPFNNAVQKADISDTELYTVVKNNGGTAKGSYDVVLKLKDSANYKWSTTDNAEVTVQFVISAAQNAWDIKPAISGWTYGETAKAPVGTAKFGTVKVVYSGKANDGTDYNSETAPTKAGSYTATFAVDETPDYSGLSEQVNFTIAKKAVTVTANDASKTYGDNDPTLTYTHTDLVGSDALVITVARASGENVNTYTITASQEDDANPNYEITFKTGTFTIQKATLTVTVEGKTAIYGDAVPNYTVKYDGFKNGDDKDDLGGTLAFDCGYAQFDDKGEYTIKASGYTSGNYTINYVDGKLNVSAKSLTVTIQNATSIYGEALTELKATDNGIVNGDSNVYSLSTTATSTSNVGKYAITGTALDGNYAITFVNGEYEITKREITITVEAKNTIVNTALPTYTYKVEGLLGEDKLVTEPTLTSDADITVIGEYDITATSADAGGNYSIKYVPAKLTVLTDDAVDAAAGYTEELNDYDPATVTSEDKAALDEILDEINTILADENITDNGKKALEEVKEQVEKLIKEITDAADATDTENIKKVKDVTAENVTPEDKTDLEKAKVDLEKALEDNGGNYTEDEKKAIEDEIKRIEDALEVIGNVEAVEELIDKLPENITKNNTDDVDAAKKAYDGLSDYEKTLIDPNTKKKLDAALKTVEEIRSPQTGDNNNYSSSVWMMFGSMATVFAVFFGIKKKKEE